jgi:hypothetical protein
MSSKSTALLIYLNKNKEIRDGYQESNTVPASDCTTANGSTGEDNDE